MIRVQMKKTASNAIIEIVVLKDKLDKGRAHLSCKVMLNIMITNSSKRS